MFRLAVLAILLAILPSLDSFQNLPRYAYPHVPALRRHTSMPAPPPGTVAAVAERCQRGGVGGVGGPAGPLFGRCEDYAERLRSKPRWGGSIVGPVVRYINDFLVGLLCTVVLKVFNRFKAVRRNVLLDLVFKRPSKRGLLTVSNHQSVFDDPGLWGALLPFWRLRPERLRWSLCTEDIFFFVSS
jgi:hypothetical protein